MNCLHPLVAYKSYDIDGTCKFQFIKGDVPRSEFERNPNLVMLPCGQCLACRKQKAREWANRCLMESLYHYENYFITLTYDDPHMFECCMNSETGNASLVPVHLTKFWKRLRKAIQPSKVRYFACGEYGDTTFRPHYHALIFGLHLDDLVFYKRSPNGDVYYNSEFLSKLWPFGYVVVAKFDWATAAYVAGYAQKKLTGKLASMYDELGIVPPYIVMSRRPGIGYQFYQDHSEAIQSLSKISIPTEKGGKTFNVPRYFRKQFDNLLENPRFNVLRTSDIFNQLSDGVRTQLDLSSGMPLDEYFQKMEEITEKTYKRRDVL